MKLPPKPAVTPDVPPPEQSNPRLVARSDVVIAIEGSPAASRRALRRLGLASVHELVRLASRVRNTEETSGPTPVRFTKPLVDR